MKIIKTVDAVGHILCHDITEIVVGEKKGPRFKKGHIVKEEDIEVLLSIGKANLYIWENQEGMVHENEAASILANICVKEDNNFTLSEVSEGKINIFAKVDGVLKINTSILNKINSLGKIAIATRHNNYPIKKNEKIAGTRVVPLLIEEKQLLTAKGIATEQLFKILPYKKIKAGIIVTGSEVFSGRIEDKFAPVLTKKLKEFGAEVASTVIVTDKTEDIINAGKKMLESGVDLILCSGGMSVDPDDKTPKAISELSTKVINYGSPVLPGTMIMVAYHKDVPIIGLPGCVMYEKRTVFDLVLPRLIAGDFIEKEDIDKLGYGGLCLECNVCTFPSCSFGKA